MTILATGMENRLEEEVKTDVHQNEDDYYEDLISRLYKPAKKRPTMATVITQQEIAFEVEPAPEPEPMPEPTPAPDPEPEPEQEPKPKDKEPTILDKWKNWLNNLMGDVVE